MQKNKIIKKNTIKQISKVSIKMISISSKYIKFKFKFFYILLYYIFIFLKIKKFHLPLSLE